MLCEFGDHSLCSKGAITFSQVLMIFQNRLILINVSYQHCRQNVAIITFAELDLSRFIESI